MLSLSQSSPAGISGMAKSVLDFVADLFGQRWRICTTNRTPLNQYGVQHDGDCSRDQKRIRILGSLRGSEFYETLLHEALHAGFDHLDEEWVDGFARDFAPILYRPEVLARCGLQRINPEG